MWQWQQLELLLQWLAETQSCDKLALHEPANQTTRST